MKKLLLLLILFATSFTNTFAQDGRTWASYYGGSGNEAGFAMTTDASGNIYMAGITSSPNAISSNGFQNTYGGGNVDAFLVKFDSSGTRLWGTYYGGPGEEMVFFGGKMGIATDAAGNVFMSGLTNSTSGIASGGFQNTIGGTVNAYLVKFDNAGNRIWSTYYGGANTEKAYSVATDLSGNVYLAGIAGSSSGIASGGFQNTIGGLTDAFLVKFDGAGNRIWATYYGGAGTEEAYSVCTDALENVYLAGITTSTDSIASGGFQNTYGGGAYDAFIVKFDSSGTRTWATYYGGSGDEMELFAGDIEITTDVSGNLYLAGLTTSTDSIASGGYQNTNGGGTADAFLVKFDPAGNRIWGTYYGGNDTDKGMHVSTDLQGNVFLAGYTATPYVIASGGFQMSYGGGYDALLVKFDSTGARLCATYFGQMGLDQANSAVTDASGKIYICGNTANFANTSYNGFQNTFGGGSSDCLIIKFTSNCNPLGEADLSATEEISVSPNPSSGLFTVNASGVKDGRVEISDMNGRTVSQDENFNGRTEIDLSGYASGIYCVRIYEGETVFLKKIVIE